MTTTTLKGKNKTALKAALFSATALAGILPNLAHAQLSIIGVLDSRTYLNRNQETPKTPVQPHPTQQSPKAAPVIPLSKFGIEEKAQEPLRPVTAPQTPPSGELDHTLFSADEIGFDKQIGVITARGNVELAYGERVLIADTVSYNQQQDMVSASGNVQIIEANGDVLFTEYLEITSDLKRGLAQNLSLALADKSTISGKSATRREGRFTTIKDATYSPCQKCVETPDKPLAWKLTANEITHDAKQKRIEYSDVFLEVYDIPVAYVPYFSHPDPTQKRESGLLAPSYGSNAVGKYLTTPYFFNISPSKDLTLTPTYYYDEKQPHLGAEYRERFSSGEIDFVGSITYSDGGKGSTLVHEEETRGHIAAEGEFDLNNTWRAGFDINAASDETYLRRYNIEHDSNDGYLTSNAYLEGFRNRNYITTQLSAYQEQRSTNTDNLQRTKLEGLYSFVSEPQRTGAFIKSDNDLYAIQRRNSTKVTRLATNSSWVLPYTSPSGEIIELDANITATGYFVDDLPRATDNHSGTSGQIVPSLNLSWRKPVAKSLLNGTANEIFEPMVNVKLAPNVGKNDQIPNEDAQDFELDDTNLFKRNRFTGIDRLDGGQRIDYGLNWGVYGQDGGYSQMFIGQSYRLRKDSTYDTNSGLEDNLSDIVGRIKVKPSELVDVLYRYRLDKNDLTLNRSETALTIGPKSTEFTVSHIYIEGTGDDSEFGTREEIFGELETQLSQFWSASVDARYRMNDPEGNVNYGADLAYQDECITITFDFRRTFSEDRDIAPDDSFSITLDLKNIGGI